ncbi:MULTISPECIES: hypothetical protein [Bacilli]|uniref:hypothetical protein n=1 Tax=Bacilli TaxID=91061 RepID=UPI0020404218|nr:MULTISPECIES: hypothetical protein [Bacilli]MCM3032917.1 hypothetical protein [Niallia sp. MER 6]MDK8746867.1 hypothetical protein [Streptococcus agalactiae]
MTKKRDIVTQRLLLIDFINIIMLAIPTAAFLLLTLFYGLTFFVPGLLFILLSTVLFEIYIRRKNKYYAYRITKAEYEKLKEKKLIHYTNKINEQEFELYKQTGMIKLSAGISAKSNYIMKFKEKRNAFIWFHKEEICNEPGLHSFLFNHLHELQPRKYKVIIEPAHINKERILVRPDNQNIIIEDDLYIKATVETDFKWCNDKFYFKEIFFPTLYATRYVIYPKFHQLYGELKDKREVKKKKPKVIA